MLDVKKRKKKKPTKNSETLFNRSKAGAGWRGPAAFVLMTAKQEGNLLIL